MWPQLCLMTSAAAQAAGQGPGSAVKDEAPAATEPKGEAPRQVEENTGASLLQEVLASPGGEGAKLCIQCGVCSSSCPNIAKMDYSPRKTIAMIRADRRDEVLASNSPWICASCYMCTVRCPRGVKPTEVMHVLERLALIHGVRTPSVTTPAMYNAFVGSINSNGRVHEVGMMMQYFLKTNPFAAMKISTVGVALMTHGRMSLKPTRIKGVKQISSMLKKARSLGGEK
jgi:heterodisulfide reductase subunit C